VAAAPESPLPDGLIAADTVRIPVAVLDHLLRLSGTLHTEVFHYDERQRETEALGAELSALEAGWGRLRQALAGELRAGTHAARAGVLGRQMEQVDVHLREATRRQKQVLHARRSSDWSIRQLDEQLQKAVRQARLVPAESVFGGFRQMARETARDLGKEVRFQVSGLDVQADRAVLQELKDPIMHVIRNAIDHGLEPPEERKQAGKDPAGTVVLAVQIARGRLQVTVTDDGRGLDLAQVRTTAIQRGLLSAEEADTLSPEQLGRLILQPGFSTTRFVTEFSGRGMGLSVAAEAVRHLQGEIDIFPGTPCGTRMQLTAPLSVSTRPLVLTEADGQTFALPSASVTRLLHAPLADVSTLEGRPQLMLDHEPLPLAGLAHLLEIGPAELQPPDERLSVAVLQVGGRRLGLVVDRFLAHTEAVLTDLGPVFSGLTHLAGGFLGANGEIILALDAEALLERFDLHAGMPGLRILRTEAALPPSILVVDDSITTRTLEKSVLEAHGYRVRVAVDGLEALGLLRQELPDLMIADVEMPRLDGFGLLEAVRQDPQLRSLPVVMVTSLEKREHREKGLALGADAYIVKRHFDQSALLETIRRLL
jgi:two-component system chemotaxis sensor kinase CheA